MPFAEGCSEAVGSGIKKSSKLQAAFSLTYKYSWKLGQFENQTMQMEVNKQNDLQLP